MRAPGSGWRSLGWLMAAAAVIASLASPAASDAAGPSQLPPQTTLSCVLGPGILNVTGSVPASVSLSAPGSVAPGGSVTFTQPSVTLTLPATWMGAFAGLGGTSISGSMTNLPVDATNASPTSADLNAPLSFSPVSVTGGQSQTVTFTGGSSAGYGPFTADPTASGQDLALSLDPAAGFTSSPFQATGHGIVFTLEGFAQGSLIAGPLTVSCTAPAGVVVASVPIGGTGTTSSTTTTSTTPPTTTSTTPPTTTTTTTTTTSSGSAGNYTLACVLAPGILNVVGNVAVSTSFDPLPASVAPGQNVTLSNFTTTLTLPGELDDVLRRLRCDFRDQHPVELPARLPQRVTELDRPRHAVLGAAARHARRGRTAAVLLAAAERDAVGRSGDGRRGRGRPELRRVRRSGRGVRRSALPRRPATGSRSRSTGSARAACSSPGR